MARQTPKKTGRPTKYRPEYAEALIEHFESYLREPYTREVIKETLITRKDGSTYETTDYKLVAKPLPSLFTFARTIEVAYFTVYRWANERVGEAPTDGEVDERPFLYPEFSEAYKTRIHYQEAYLSAVGLPGIANPAYAIFTAKNVIGWRDSVDQRFIDKDGNAVTPSYIVLPRRLDASETAVEYADHIPA